MLTWPSSLPAFPVLRQERPQRNYARWQPKDRPLCSRPDAFQAVETPDPCNSKFLIIFYFGCTILLSYDGNFCRFCLLFVSGIAGPRPGSPRVVELGNPGSS